MGRFLSKTRLMSARQCLKRLYLETHQADLANVSSATEAAFRTGHQVGAIARDIYGSEHAATIQYAEGLGDALNQTRRLLAAEPRYPVFEATFQFRGVLVRVDVLLPDGDGWRIVEVKATTSVKEEHAFDCAIQSWVFQGLGFKLNGIHLAHIDNTFVYAGDKHYSGLLVEYDIGARVSSLLPAVPDWIEAASGAMGDVQPDIPVGSHCNQPYECPFTDFCWPSATEYPVQLLPRASRSRLAEYIAEGFLDLRDVPADRLTEQQRRVQRISVAGRAELLPAAAEELAALDYPRYYLDFETISPAVPVWAGTRPYEALPIQWSCHYESAPGQLAHAEFLDLSGEPPMRRLAESLLRACGRSGPVFVYTSYEKRILGALGERFPDLAGGLSALVARLVDLAPLTRDNFYAPGMRGSWSLKAVTPAVAADMSYVYLEGIQDGTAASEGYLEAIGPDTEEPRKTQLKEQLLRYCQFDTLAMVKLAHFLASSQPT